MPEVHGGGSMAVSGYRNINFELNYRGTGMSLLKGSDWTFYPTFYYLFNYLLEMDKSLKMDLKVKIPPKDKLLRYASVVLSRTYDMDKTNYEKPLSRVVEGILSEIESLPAATLIGSNTDEVGDLHEYLIKKIYSYDPEIEKDDYLNKLYTKQVESLREEEIYDRFREAFVIETIYAHVRKCLDRNGKLDLTMLKAIPEYSFVENICKKISYEAEKHGFAGKTEAYWMTQMLEFTEEAFLTEFVYILELDQELTNLFLIKAFKRGMLDMFIKEEYILSLVLNSSEDLECRKALYDKLLDFYDKEAGTEEALAEIPAAKKPKHFIDTIRLANVYAKDYKGASLTLVSGEIKKSVKQLLSAHTRLIKMAKDNERKRTIEQRFEALLYDILSEYRKDVDGFLGEYQEENTETDSKPCVKIFVVQPEENNPVITEKFFSAKKEVFHTAHKDILEVGFFSNDEKAECRANIMIGKPRNYRVKETKNASKQCLKVTVSNKDAFKTIPQDLFFWQKVTHKVKLVEVIDYEDMTKTEKKNVNQKDECVGNGLIQCVAVGNRPVTISNGMIVVGERDVRFEVSGLESSVTFKPKEYIERMIELRPLASRVHRAEVNLKCMNPSLEVDKAYNKSVTVEGGKTEIQTFCSGRPGALLPKGTQFEQLAEVDAKKEFIFSVTADAPVDKNATSVIVEVTPLMTYNVNDQSFYNNYQNRINNSYGFSYSCGTGSDYKTIKIGKGAPALVLNMPNVAADGKIRITLKDSFKEKAIKKGTQISIRVKGKAIQQSLFETTKDFIFCETKSYMEIPVHVNPDETNIKRAFSSYNGRRSAFAIGGHPVAAIYDRYENKISGLDAYFKSTIYTADSHVGTRYNTQNPQIALERLIRYLYPGQIKAGCDLFVLKKDLLKDFSQLSFFEQRSMFILLIFLYVLKHNDAKQEERDIYMLADGGNGEEDKEIVTKEFKAMIEEMFENTPFTPFQNSYFVDQFFLHVLLKAEGLAKERLVEYQKFVLD